MKYTTVLTIAGSDCSGGAGIQADIKTISALGCYAASAITAVTVQNTCGVSAIHPVPAEIVGAQIRCVAEDIPLDAIKIGMVTDEDIITTIAEVISLHKVPVVFDPVLVSSSGTPLVAPQAMETLLNRLIPVCDLLTPNLPETEILSGTAIHNDTDRITAGRKILALGCKAVLIKGGHLSGNDTEDLLLTAGEPDNIRRFHGKRITTRNTHGTGCTLSSAIAAYIARGHDLPEAVMRSKEYLSHALSAGKDVVTGQGCGPLNHFFEPKKLIIR